MWGQVMKFLEWNKDRWRFNPAKIWVFQTCGFCFINGEIVPAATINLVPAEDIIFWPVKV